MTWQFKNGHCAARPGEIALHFEAVDLEAVKAGAAKHLERFRLAAQRAFDDREEVKRHRRVKIQAEQLSRMATLARAKVVAIDGRRSVLQLEAAPNLGAALLEIDRERADLLGAAEGAEAEARAIASTLAEAEAGLPALAHEVEIAFARQAVTALEPQMQQVVNAKARAVLEFVEQAGALAAAITAVGRGYGLLGQAPPLPTHLGLSAVAETVRIPPPT